MNKSLAKRLTIMFARLLQLGFFLIIAYEVLWNFRFNVSAFCVALILVLEYIISRVERINDEN
jgi:hypothetical protein